MTAPESTDARLRLTALVAVALLAACTSTPDPTRTLRVLSYNIKHGLGNDGALDLDRVAEVIRATDPDLVALQEVDQCCARSGDVDQARSLGEMLGMESRFGRFMDYDGGEYGMALLSRLPVLASENHVLPPGREPRSALAAEVRLRDGTTTLTVVGIHLYATPEERLAQAQTLVDLFEDASHPVLLIGDFNSTPDSEVIELLTRHWTNPDKGEDHLTFSSDDPRTEIDFTLYRPADRFRVLELDVLDEPVVSDHRPVLLVLEVLGP